MTLEPIRCPRTGPLVVTARSNRLTAFEELADVAVKQEVEENEDEALDDNIPKFRESNINEPIWIDDDDEDDDGNDAASEINNGGEEDEDEFDIDLDFGVDADAALPEHNGVGPYTCTTLEEAAPVMAYLRSANRLVEALWEVCKMEGATMSLDVTPRYVPIDDHLTTYLQHNSSTSTDGGMQKELWIPSFQQIHHEKENA